MQNTQFGRKEKAIVLEVDCAGLGNRDRIICQKDGYDYKFCGLMNSERMIWFGRQTPICFSLHGLKQNKEYDLFLEIELLGRVFLTQKVIVSGNTILNEWDGSKITIPLEPVDYPDGSVEITLEPNLRYSGLNYFKLKERKIGSPSESDTLPIFREPQNEEKLLNLESLLGTPKEQRFQPYQIYFSEGYHGGFWLGDVHDHHFFFQTLFDFMEVDPLYTSNLEIEGYTWEQLAQMPEFQSELGRLRHYIDHGRIDLVGSYVQPYNLAFLKGEDIIRQLWYSKRIIKEMFDLEVITYSSQYPYLTTQLPQIFKGLGINFAVRSMWSNLRLSHSKVWWQGADDTRIQFVPKYVIQRQLNSTSEEYPFPNFLERCKKASIAYPLLNNLRDMGGPTREVLGEWFFGHPILKKMRPYLTLKPDVVFTTYRDYFRYTPEPSATWTLTEPDPDVRWAYWGGLIQQANRKAENAIDMAERLAGLGSLFFGQPYPSTEVYKAWQNLMLSQNICCWAEGPEGPVIGQWNHNPIFRSDGEASVYWTGLTYRVAQQIIECNLKLVAKEISVLPNKQMLAAFMVFNTLSHARTDVVNMLIHLPASGAQIRMIDSQGHEVPCQLTRKTDSKTFLSFLATAVPALGYETYMLLAGQPISDDTIHVRYKGSYLTMENKFYRLRLDAARGGCITSLFDKKNHKEWVDSKKGLANDLSAFFIELGRTVRLSDKPAEIEVLNNGPVGAHVVVRSHLDAHPVNVHWYFYSQLRRIDCFLEIDFLKPIFIGYRTEGGGSTNRDIQNQHKKLRINFPLSIKNGTVVRDLPFDVVVAKRSAFHSLSWVDVSNVESGLAVITDRTGLFLYQDGILSHIIGFGSYYWYSDYYLIGKYFYKYSLLPHSGDRSQASLPQEAMGKEHPLLVERTSVQRGKLPTKLSFIEVEPKDIFISSMLGEDGWIYLRIFNPLNDKKAVQVRFWQKIPSVFLTRLDGKRIKELKDFGESETLIKLEIDKRKIVTLGIHCREVLKRVSLPEVKPIRPPSDAREKALGSSRWKTPVDLSRWPMKDDKPQETAKKRFLEWGWESPPNL